MSKKFIDVDVNFNECGEVKPLRIKWEDGRVFEIDRVIDIRRASSRKSGGIGTRFTCMIRNKQVYLFQDENLWFIE